MELDKKPTNGERPPDRVSVQGTPCFLDTATPHALQEIAARVSLSCPPDDLLRGVPLSAILRGMGSVLGSSAGEASDYMLSEPVQEIAQFVSHNWSTPRYQKFSALAVHSHLTLAIVAAWVAGALTAALTACGQLPEVAISSAFHLTGTYCFNSVLVGYLTFFIFLCFGGEILWLLGLSPTTFFDKLCIHQTDEKLKAHGIQNLASFLLASRQMVVVYSDSSSAAQICQSYLRKLWTVYEVASFLILRGGSNIVLVPALQGYRLATVMLLTVVIIYGCRLPGFLSLPSGVHAWLTFVMKGGSTIAAFIVYTVTTRLWKKEVHQIEQAIQTFSIEEAACAVESDRALVQDNICTFMKCLKLVPVDTTPSATLSAFDKLVHQKLPSALEVSFGRNLLPYRFLIAATLGLALNAMDMATIRWRAGRPWQVVTAPLLDCWTGNLCVIPICYSYLASVLSAHMHLTGSAEVYFVASRCLLLFPICFLQTPMTLAHLFVGKWDGSFGHVLCFTFMCVYPLLMIVLTFWLYRPTPEEEVSELRSTAVPAPDPVGEEDWKDDWSETETTFAL